MRASTYACVVCANTCTHTTQTHIFGHEYPLVPWLQNTTQPIALDLLLLVQLISPDLQGSSVVPKFEDTEYTMGSTRVLDTEVNQILSQRDIESYINGAHWLERQFIQQTVPKQNQRASITEDRIHLYPVQALLQMTAGPERGSSRLLAHVFSF